MPIWDRNPHDELGELGKGPRHYPAATEVLDSLWGVDTMPTAVQPFEPLRDAISPMRRYVPAESVMDLPIWRPGKAVALPPPVPEPALKAAPIEQTAEELLTQAHGNLFSRLKRDLLDWFREEKDEEVLSVEQDRDVFRSHMDDLDEWACEHGFLAAVTRRLGRRLMSREISPQDAARELQALV